jgi:hypothetical protein
MRCECCNRILSDYEATAKNANTGAYLNACLFCLKDTGIEIDGRKDLDPTSEYLEDEYYSEDSQEEF